MSGRAETATVDVLLVVSMLALLWSFAEQLASGCGLLVHVSPCR